MERSNKTEVFTSKLKRPLVVGLLSLASLVSSGVSYGSEASLPTEPTTTSTTIPNGCEGIGSMPGSPPNIPGENGTCLGGGQEATGDGQQVQISSQEAVAPTPLPAAPNFTG